MLEYRLDLLTLPPALHDEFILASFEYGANVRTFCMSPGSILEMSHEPPFSSTATNKVLANAQWAQCFHTTQISGNWAAPSASSCPPHTECWVSSGKLVPSQSPAVVTIDQLFMGDANWARSEGDLGKVDTSGCSVSYWPWRRDLRRSHCHTSPEFIVS